MRDRQNRKIKTIYPGTYTVNGKDIRAWDLREYTRGNYDLKETTPKDLAILTYYTGFQDNQDNFFA